MTTTSTSAQKCYRLGCRHALSDHDELGCRGNAAHPSAIAYDPTTYARCDCTEANRVAVTTTLAPPTVADILTRAADGYRSGAIRWGQGNFLSVDGCRCMAGAIVWAVAPNVHNGIPSLIAHPSMRRTAYATLNTVADLLVNEYGAEDAGDSGPSGAFMRDVVEVIGNWNDDLKTTVGDVLDVLDAAARRAENPWPPTVNTLDLDDDGRPAGGRA